MWIYLQVSQLTTGFGEESESESEEEQCREPGEPGTSLPNLELSLSLSSALTQPILVPVTPGMPGMHRPLTASNRPPTKLRRIEPKPMAGLSIPTSMPTVGLEQQSPVMQQNQQQTAMMVPLTVVTVPQVHGLSEFCALFSPSDAATAAPATAAATPAAATATITAAAATTAAAAHAASGSACPAVDTAVDGRAGGSAGIFYLFT